MKLKRGLARRVRGHEVRRPEPVLNDSRVRWSTVPGVTELTDIVFLEMADERLAITGEEASIISGPGRSCRFHVHFTPNGAPWINLVERFFAD